MWIDVPNFIIMFKEFSFTSEHNIVHLDITCYVINHGAFESERDYSCRDQHFHSSTPVCKRNKEKEKTKKQTPYKFSFSWTRSLMWNMNSKTRERDTRTLWDLVGNSENKVEVKGQRGWETQVKQAFENRRVYTLSKIDETLSFILTLQIKWERESRAGIRSLSTLFCKVKQATYRGRCKVGGKWFIILCTVREGQLQTSCLKGHRSRLGEFQQKTWIWLILEKRLKRTWRLESQFNM